MALLAVLGLCVSAFALARALGVRRPAELVVASWALAVLLVLLPTHLLGVLGRLTRGALVGWSLATQVGALSIAAAARGLPGFRADLLDAARFPFRVARAFPGGAAWPLAAVFAWVLVRSVLGALLLPSDAWDGIWYHDTITGWAIQSGGYEPMPLPQNLLQQVNGFPRAAEMVGAWLVLFSDRALIELPNATAALPFAAATYLLAARFGRRRDLAAALALIVALAPACVLQLRSTYVDVFAAAAATAALHFATKRPLATRDVLLGGLCLSLWIGTKTSALFGAPLCALALLAGLRAARGRWRVLATLAATALPLAALSLTYLRNALRFHNPIWPLPVRAPRLGLDWPGAASPSDLDVAAPLATTLRSIFLPTAPGRDFPDLRSGGYGLAVAWGLAPLALLGFALAARRVALARRVGATRAARVAGARARAALALVGLLLPSFLLSPAIWSARYHLAFVAALTGLGGLALARLPRRAALALVAGATGLSVARLASFDPPLGGATLSELGAAARATRAERAAAAPASFTLAPDVARLRDQTLGPESLTVFGDGVTFPSVLWNERFDNRVVYVPDDTPAGLAKTLDRLAPTWIVARPDEPLYRYARERPERWRPIGLASRGQPTWAFARIGPAEP